jgi:D-alanyl-D-alanine endopeptidase (penicillin-binding protein 7)
MARSMDLVMVHRWLNGDETPVAMPRVYHASTQYRHHQVITRSHWAKAQLTAYRTNSNHHSGKRHLRLAS